MSRISNSVLRMIESPSAERSWRAVTSPLPSEPDSSIRAARPLGVRSATRASRTAPSERPSGAIARATAAGESRTRQ